MIYNNGVNQKLNTTRRFVLPILFFTTTFTLGLDFQYNPGGIFVLATALPAVNNIIIYLYVEVKHKTTYK